MDVFRTENNCLKFHYDAEELWIQPWGANSFRIRATKLAEMPKENWALEMPVEDIVPKIQIEEKRASIFLRKKALEIEYMVDFIPKFSKEISELQKILKKIN